MRFLTNLTLGKKITLLTTAGLLLGLGVFSSLGLRAVDQATETMLQDRLTTARLVADYLDEALGRALTELGNTAQMIDSLESRETIESKASALEDAYSRLSIHTHAIILIDGEGQVVWAEPDDLTAPGFDVSAYEVAVNASGAGSAGVSRLISAPATGTPVVLLSSALGRGEGAAGTLVAAIDVSQSAIGGFVQPIRLGQTGYVEIVDQDGVVVARTEPGPELAPFEQSDHSGHFASLIADGEPTRGVCHTCHEAEQKVQRRDVLAFVPLSEANWGVVVRQSEEEALAPTRDLRTRLLIFGVVLVSIALIFVVVTTRDVGGRIRMLTAASRRIADGDLASPVAALGKDEVGILSQSLDDMRVKLETSYDELERKTNELSSLLSVSKTLTSTLDLPNLLEAVVAKAVEVISGANAGLLLLESLDRGGPTVQCAVGLEAVGLDKRSLSEWAATSGEEAPQRSRSEARERESNDDIKKAIASFLEIDQLRSRVQSFISADVLHRGKQIGSIIMMNFQDADAFSASDRRLLQAVADGVAIATERSQLATEAEEARALYEADRLRSQFISSVSHELRTPLTLIKGYSTSLLRSDVSWDAETQGEFLQVIDEKTDELRDLIDKILQSAKLEAGALRLEKEPLLIPRLAQKVVEEISPRSERHKFAVKFPRSFPVVEADVRCIEQVLRNLVENAVKYSPAGGEVAIAGEINDGQVVVSVSDEGLGIPPEDRERVFERFYRVGSPLARRSPGSGLGLSITKGHVEAHGGRVWLDSTVGRGSKFYFSLPLSPVDNGD
jgi:signal transduction histidine kinase/HAMP domain-containing protein